MFRQRIQSPRFGFAIEARKKTVRRDIACAVQENNAVFMISGQKSSDTSARACEKKSVNLKPSVVEYN